MTRILALLALSACIPATEVPTASGIGTPGQPVDAPVRPDKDPATLVHDPDEPTPDSQAPNTEPPSLEPPDHPLFEPTTDNANGGVIASFDDGETLLIADTDNGELLVLDETLGLTHRVHLGGEPSRVLATQGHAYVTLRATGEVVHVAQYEDGWHELGRTPVGAEPVGLALVDGVLFVALSQEDAVVALHPTTLTEQWRVPALHEPRWMVATTDDLGRSGVAVVSANKPVLTWATTDGSVVATELPPHERYTPGTYAQCTQRTMALRTSGDPTVLDSGLILVPAVHIDHKLRTALRDPWTCNRQAEAPNLYYAPPMPPRSDKEVGRWNPILQAFGFVAGVPVPRQAVHIGASSGDTMLRSIPTGAHAVRGVDGEEYVAVASETSDTLLLVTVQAPLDAEPLDSGFVGWPTEAISTSGMPRIGTTGDGVVTWSLHDRRVESWRPHTSTLHTTPSDLPLEVRRGRRLFHTSNDTRVVSANSGGACANCHAEGRNDGLTWELEVGDRQTPSLAGRVSETMPATWTLSVGTVAEEAHLTSAGRMGGQGLPSNDLDAIATYIEWTRPVIRPEGNPAMVDEGRDLFHDPVVGCADCHSGDRGTDNRHHQVFDYAEATNTPTLTGIAATGPYLHDGSEPSLRHVLERARDGRMGNTSQLTEHQIEALLAYLKQL